MTAKSKSANSLSVKTEPFKSDEQQSKSAFNRPKTVGSILNSSTPNLTVVDKNGDDKPECDTVLDDVDDKTIDHIPDVYKTQGTMKYSSCTGYSESTCLCSSIDENNRIGSVKRVSYLERRSWISTERICQLRKQAQDAIKHHKIFTIRGCFYSIRKSLLQRGWIEKLDIHRRAPINGSCQVILEDIALQHLPQRKPGETRRQHVQKCERNIMSRFLEHMPIDFLWSARKEKSDWIDMARNPNLAINRFHKCPFTTKEGLCNILQNVHWFFEEGKSECLYPRSYSVCSADDLDELIEDYRMTACMSMLRFLVNNHTNKTAIGATAENGPIPLSSIRFALSRCKNFVRTCQHLDIDEETESLWNHDWELFLMHFQMLTKENLKFAKSNDLNQWNALIEECKQILLQISKYWPQSNLDGVSNIWIVKPSNRCRGRGIHLMSDIKKIIAHVNPPLVNKGHYVVQKYIERPMIIHKCKFDIRQWFLVTSVQPLVIWIYKESYLRFSSQEYDLDNFHESVHLTNHAIQKRYENGKRDERLPRENMWDCHTFQAYLRQIGKSDMWSQRIYPGMQRALIGTMLASQDSMDRRSNTFELFGADFMICEDFYPWLIEINASPDLGATTSVTARLCPQCLEDVIKVVIDYRNDPKSSTGGFEMIYRQVIPPAPAYLGLNLLLKGTQIATKNCNGKKEKQKSDILKRKNTQIQAVPLNGNDTINPSNLFSPRLLDLNLSDVTNNKLNPIDFNTNSKWTARMNISPRKKLIDAASQLRTTKSTKENSKFVGDNLNSARRNTSFETKLLHNLKLDDNRAENSEHVHSKGDANKIKCIGNKCTAPLEIPMKQSPRKSLNDSSRVWNSRAKLKPLSTTATDIRSKNGIRTDRTLNDYRKYVSRNFEKVNGLSSAKRCNTSHFHAVGLSLRAWQSKYNNLKSNASSTASKAAQIYGNGNGNKLKSIENQLK